MDSLQTAFVMHSMWWYMIQIRGIGSPINIVDASWYVDQQYEVTVTECLYGCIQKPTRNDDRSTSVSFLLFTTLRLASNLMGDRRK